MYSKFLKSVAPKTKEEAVAMVRAIPGLLNDAQQAVPLSTKGLLCYIAYQHLKEKKTFESKMKPILKEKEREHERHIQKIRDEYKVDPLAKTAADFQKNNEFLERALEELKRELASVRLESEKRRFSEEKLKRESVFFQQEMARLSGELAFLASSEDHIKDLQSKLLKLEEEIKPLRKNEQKRMAFKRLHGERLLQSRKGF
jgi:valyl-tRNA synthetase